MLNNNPNYAMPMNTSPQQSGSMPLAQFDLGEQTPGYMPDVPKMQLGVGYGISPDHLEKAYETELRVYEANEKKICEYGLKTELEFQKHQFAMKREETRERHRRERELVQIRVFENADGRICLEHRYPDGSCKMSQPVLRIGKMKMQKITSQMFPENNHYRIKWRENPNGIKIPTGDMTAKKIAQAFQRNGIVLDVSRTKKSETWEGIISFLFENMEEVENPAVFGWNLTEHGWLFNWES